MLRVIEGGGEPSRPFTGAEDQLIRQLYGKLSARRIGNIIGRKPHEINAYARFWGLRGGGVTVYDGGKHG